MSSIYLSPQETAAPGTRYAGKLCTGHVIWRYASKTGTGSYESMGLRLRRDVESKAKHARITRVCLRVMHVLTSLAGGMEMAKHGYSESGYACICGGDVNECSGLCEGGMDDRDMWCAHCRIAYRRERAEHRSEMLYASGYGLGL